MTEEIPNGPDRKNAVKTIRENGWDTRDQALYDRLVAQCPLGSEAAVDVLATKIVRLEQQIRGLMQIVGRNADEERALVQAQSQIQKALEGMMLLKKTKDQLGGLGATGPGDKPETGGGEDGDDEGE